MSLQPVFPRRVTTPCRIGNLTIGSGHPVVVQSMITEETRNVEGCVAQIIELHKAGCELVRVTTPSLGEAECLAEIRAKVTERHGYVPLTADVHHQGTDIAVEAAKHVDEVRVNPGLFVFRRHGTRAQSATGASVDVRGREETEVDRLRAELAYDPASGTWRSKRSRRASCPSSRRASATTARFASGVNHGSLSERILITYGDTPRGMVESAMEYLRLGEKHGFTNFNISAKASRASRSWSPRTG